MNSRDPLRDWMTPEAYERMVRDVIHAGCCDVRSRYGDTCTLPMSHDGDHTNDSNVGVLHTLGHLAPIRRPVTLLRDRMRRPASPHPLPRCGGRGRAIPPTNRTT